MTLRQSIRDTLAKHDEPVAPAGIAAEVVKGMTPKERNAALTEALTSLVREVIVQQRPSTPNPGPTTAKSWKRSAIRQAEQFRVKELAARYATEDGYKALGEFDYDEMVALADRTQEMGERNLAASARFRGIAASMKKRGAARVADLPEGDLDDLGSAA